MQIQLFSLDQQMKIIASGYIHRKLLNRPIYVRDELEKNEKLYHLQMFQKYMNKLEQSGAELSQAQEN